MSLAILVSATAITLSTPDSSTIVSCAAISANLLGAETNGSWVSFDTSVAKFSANPSDRITGTRPLASAGVATRKSIVVAAAG